MAHLDHDLSDLLAALQAGEMTDAIRTSLQWVLQQLLEAEASTRIGAERFERTDERVTQRNGHRPRLLSTPAGDVELAIPKLRVGSFFRSLLERRRRIDRALFAVVMEAYVHGVLTRKVDDLVKSLGVGTGISKSEVSRICAGLDTELEAFRNRPLDHVEFPYVFADATYVKGRLRGRVVSRDRHRRPRSAGYRGRRLRRRRLLDGVPQGSPGAWAAWRAARDLRSPPRPQRGDRLGVHWVVVAALPGALHAQCLVEGAEGLRRDGRGRGAHRVRPTRRGTRPSPARRGDSHARCAVPRRRQHALRRHRGPARLLCLPPGPLAQAVVDQSAREGQRRDQASHQRVGIFPNDGSVLRLVTAVVVETHDEWAVSERRYLSEESMAKLYTSAETVATETPLAAITA